MTLRLKAEDPLLRQFLSPSELAKLAKVSKRKVRNPDEPTAEDHIEATLRNVGLAAGMVRQYVFHPTRKWRLDFAWPEHKLALEYQGLVIRRIGGEAIIRGRHATLEGIRGDMEKFNTAQSMGWVVLLCEQESVKTAKIFIDVSYMLSIKRGLNP